MKYFIDTEFHEYHKQPKVCGVKIGKPIPTIDLISIGIVNEDNKEYYAVSKDFNIKDAWNEWQWENDYDNLTIARARQKCRNYNGYPKGSYWLRENILKPIYFDLLRKYEHKSFANSRGEYERVTLPEFERIINKYGKTNSQIAKEIKKFVFKGAGQKVRFDNSIEFYAYYADYDWVVFAQLFGKMIDLPKGFPMYCKDLKQMLDEKANTFISKTLVNIDIGKTRTDVPNATFNQVLNAIKNKHNYPKQENEHNALDDAKWNKKLYEFLKNNLN